MLDCMLGREKKETWMWGAKGFKPCIPAVQLRDKGNPKHFDDSIVFYNKWLRSTIPHNCVDPLFKLIKKCTNRLHLSSL